MTVGSPETDSLDLLAHQYRRDGFVLVPGLFLPREIEDLASFVDKRWAEREQRIDFADSQGRTTSIQYVQHLGEDPASRASRSARIERHCARFLGEAPLFFYGRSSYKPPKSGAWEWHQDFRAWHMLGFLYPRMLSAMIAIDPASRHNGALQVLPGSHTIGRLDHVTDGPQAVVQPRRMALLLELFDVATIEMAPGDVLFFDCNLVHGSAPNESDRPRRAHLSTHTAVSNYFLPFP